MTFSGHVAVAGLILQLCPNPVLAVSLNVIAHPILDAIPHAEWSTFRRQRDLAVLITVVDLAIAICYIRQLFLYMPDQTQTLVVVLLASVWLDILDYPARYVWPALRRFHLYTHSWPEPPVEPIDWNRTVTGRTPLLLKLLIQTTLVIWPYNYLVVR